MSGGAASGEPFAARGARAAVQVRGGQGVQVGDHTTQINEFHLAAARAAAVVVPVRPDAAADAALVGREGTLAELLGLLDPRPGGAAPVVVSAVGGAPGVGKTALAWAAARAALGRGWFPGGVLAVDLHGYDPDPDNRIGSEQLYPGLLRGLGLDRDRVPPEPSEQATVYHQLLGELADTGRTVLLLLDNVADPTQIEPVLPRGAGAHRVLVTSRDTLAELPSARLLDLPVLSPDAAVKLLDAALTGRAPGDDRARREPAAAERLVELCGYLPLAVQIVAALLADEPGRPVGEWVDELADEATRLEALAYSGRWAVRAAFDLSYQRLDPDTAQLFGQLAAIPGPDLGLDTAAAAADQPAAKVRARLRRLTRAHLLEAQPSGQRWGMHDLIRLYAIEHLSDDHRELVYRRVLGWYRYTAGLAVRRFTALPGDVVPAGFDTRDQAMDWFAQERPGLVATITTAAARHPVDIVWLAVDLARFWGWTRSLQDWVATAAAAAAASNTLTDGHTIAAAWTNLGMALSEVRRFDDAITAHARAGEIYREVGDRHGEGTAWNNLGLALRQLRRFDEAITAHARAGEIYREVGDRHGEGTAWNNLGLALGEVGRIDEAVTAHERAGEIYREVEDRPREGTAWNNLGIALRQLCRFDEAITAHQRAGEISREVADRYSEGQAWNNLGLALGEVGRFDEAITAHERAGEIFRAVGDRHGEGQVWNNLGIALWRARRFEEAITAYEHDIAICVELGDRYGQAQTMGNLGVLLVQLERIPEAWAAWASSLVLYDAVGAAEHADRTRGWLAALDPVVGQGGQ